MEQRTFEDPPLSQKILPCCGLSLASQGVNWLWQFLGNTQQVKNRRYLGLSENVGWIFPMIASHFSWRDNDQQNHWVQWGLAYFQTHPFHPNEGCFPNQRHAKFGITRPKKKLVPGLATCPFHPHPGEDGTSFRASWLYNVPKKPSVMEYKPSVMDDYHKNHPALSENVVYPHTQWFCWSLSLLNGYFLGVYPIFRHTHPVMDDHFSDLDLWWL